jgi:hypothetical protein
VFSGCAIQRRNSNQPGPNLLEAMQRVREFVEQNFENVGEEFPEKARAMHYGMEEKRGIYGATSLTEIRELREEGIEAIPLPEVEKINN